MYFYRKHWRCLPAWLGIVIIAAGLAVLASSALSKAFDKHNLTAVVLAILCGLITVAYTLLDAAGVLSTTNAFTYIVWLFALDGLVMIGLLFVKDGQNIKQEMHKLWRIGILGGVMAFLGYGCMILALRLGASATVASLPTLSVLFATLIGVFIFKETMDKQRICAAILIIIGAIILSYA